MHSEDSEDSKTDSENDPETNTEADSENDSETDTETDLEADPVLVDSFTKRNDGKEVIANLLRHGQRPTEEWVIKNGKRVKVLLVYNSKRPEPNNATVKYKTAMCRNPSNCPYGNNCTFAHSTEEMNDYKKIQSVVIDYYKMAEGKSLDHHELCQNQQCPVRLRLLLKKTVLCKYYEEERCFKSDSSCSYAHGEHDLKPLPKYEMCKRYRANKCNLKSSECVYAHGKDELRRPGGKREVPARYEIESDTSDPEMHSDSSESITSNKKNWRVGRYKTVMCRNLPDCHYGIRCKFAHNRQELRTRGTLSKRPSIVSFPGNHFPLPPPIIAGCTFRLCGICQFLQYRLSQEGLMNLQHPLSEMLQ